MGTLHSILVNFQQLPFASLCHSSLKLKPVLASRVQCFWNHVNSMFMQAKTFCQWCNYAARAVPENKTPLFINLDETSIGRVYAGI